MLEVLPDRILKLALFLVNGLGPLGLILLTENPAAQVLCFDHKHAEARNVYMVDLRRAAAIWNGNVVKYVIVIRGEV